MVPALYFPSFLKGLHNSVSRFMFLQTQKVLKDFHQALLYLKQIFIPEDYGVILVRLVVATVVIAHCCLQLEVFLMPFI